MKLRSSEWSSVCELKKFVKGTGLVAAVEVVDVTIDGNCRPSMGECTCIIR